MLANFYHSADLEFVRGQGVWLWTKDGQKYFDAINGVGSNILGHCSPELMQTAHEQIDTLWQIGNQIKDLQRNRLAQRLCKLANMDQVFFHASGSEAIDLALKITRWNRPGGILVVDQAFHGTTFGGTVLTQWPGAHESIDCRELDIEHVYPNDDLDQVDFSSLSAVFVEPILGMGGGRAVDMVWLRDIYNRAKRAGCIVVADECQCGFYRCGGISVMQDWGLEPDILILSKGLANGLPLSACLFSNTFALKRHGTTYGGSSLSCAVANQVLDVIQTIDLEQQRSLVKNILGPLRNLPVVNETRFFGHMLAIDLDCSLDTAWNSCVNHGILTIRGFGNNFRMLLPVNTTKQELEYLYQCIKKALS